MLLARKLTEFDYGRAALDLQVEGEALMAVGQTESRGEGFDADGFPVILFERHKFYKNASRSKRDEWQRSMPDICHRERTPKGGYGSKASQRVKFSKAWHLDPEAAMMACSWGAFQELGENYDDYGFKSVGEFVNQMKSGIAGQLDIFVRSIKKRGLIDELRRKDWRGFARNYNGPAYEDFKYHTKMGAAYAEFKQRNIDWAKIMSEGEFLAELSQAEIEPLIDAIGPSSTADPAGSQTSLPTWPADTVDPPEEEAGGVIAQPVSPAADGQPTETKATAESEDGKQSVEVLSKNEQDVNVPAQVTEPEPYNKIGFWATIKRDLLAVTGGNVGFETLSSYATNASGWPAWVVTLFEKLAVFAIVVGAGYLVFRVIHYSIDSWKKHLRVQTEAAAKTAIDRKDIEWVTAAKTP